MGTPHPPDFRLQIRLKVLLRLLGLDRPDLQQGGGRPQGPEVILPRPRERVGRPGSPQVFRRRFEG